MIKVINGYKLKQGADLQPVLLKLREHAMSYPGYVGAENLVSDKDPSIVAIITTWDNVEQWRDWQGSRMRGEIMKEAEPLLEEELRVSVYRVIPTVRWVG
ncbi:MAG: antibiotic biosynthesis monooxygenase [Dehalococcoidales bacterium]|nr:antibiotic biosynthesis monooxygenase [Dehalococcoidales bacterium]